MATVTGGIQKAGRLNWSLEEVDMSDYKQKLTSMPHIEVVVREKLNEKQCYHLERLLCEVTLKYLHHIGINTPGVTCGRNTGINPFAPLEFRDECGMSVVELSDLVFSEGRSWNK